MTRISMTLSAFLALAACTSDDESLGDDGSELCEAMDAVGGGGLDQLYGVKWNGTDCEAIAGDQCSGSDCDALFESFDDCQQACQQPCDSTGDSTPCPDGQFCSAPNFGCGEGYCTAAPDDCELDQTGPVCGCDGTTYETLCEAQQAGVATEEFNACE